MLNLKLEHILTYEVYNNKGVAIYPENVVVDTTEEVTVSFEVGEAVQLKNGANYANGKAIPEWVFEKKLYVREINKTTGNITISTALKGAITGVVKASDLAYYIETNPGNKVSTFVPYLIKVSVDILNVRFGPGTGYRINTQVKKNQVYTIIDEKNGWGKLKSGAGWISLQYARKI